MRTSIPAAAVWAGVVIACGGRLEGTGGAGANGNGSGGHGGSPHADGESSAGARETSGEPDDLPAFSLDAGATLECEPVVAARVDLLFGCIGTPQPMGCTSSGLLECDDSETMSIDPDGGCWHTPSTCMPAGATLAPGDGPEGTCRQEAVALPRCAHDFGPCGEPCESTLVRPENLGDAGGGTIPCDIQLPPPPEGQPLEPGLLNVVVPPTDVKDGPLIEFRAVPNASSCTSDGWYLDDWRAPTSLHLCPTACDIATRAGSLWIIFGCNGVRADGLCFW